MNRIAVLDWGIGGFGFWNEWKKHRPEEGMIYFSDSGFAPYGLVSEEQLRERIEKIIVRLSKN